MPSFDRVQDAFEKCRLQCRCLLIINSLGTLDKLFSLLQNIVCFIIQRRENINVKKLKLPPGSVFWKGIEDISNIDSEQPIQASNHW